MPTESQIHSGQGYLGTDTLDGAGVWLLHTPDGTAHSIATHEWDSPVTGLSTTFYDMDKLEKVSFSAYLNGVLIPWDESWVSEVGSEVTTDGAGNFGAISTDNDATSIATRSFKITISGEVDKVVVDAQDTTTTTGRNILYKFFTYEEPPPPPPPAPTLDEFRECFKTLFGISFDEAVKSVAP